MVASAPCTSSVLRALSMQVWPAASSGWPTAWLGPADLDSASCTPALAHASSLDTDRTRNARAPTSTRSTGLCAIWDCIKGGVRI